MAEAKRISALKRHWVGVVPARAKVEGFLLAEVPFLGKLLLQGDPRDKPFSDPVGLALGFPLPRMANTSVKKDVLCLWLSPSSWLMVTEEGRETALLATLAEKTKGQNAAVSDVSDLYTALHLEGAHVRDVLAKGMSIDLHPSAFPPRKAARTLLAGSPVILYHAEDATRFEIYVDSSEADYVWNWLLTAAREHLRD